MLKVELHTHTSDDPADLIPHSTSELIDRAAALGYDAIAVTLHDRQLDLAPWRAQAAERGIVLIPGVERTLEGRHVLLLNFPAAAEGVESFTALRALKDRFGGLVVAPHPFYPHTTCVGSLLDQHADLFDAVEFSWFYTAGSRYFNDRAVKWARAHGRPVVGNGGRPSAVAAREDLLPRGCRSDAREHLRGGSRGTGIARDAAGRRPGGDRLLQRPHDGELHQVVARADGRAVPAGRGAGVGLSVAENNGRALAILQPA
jgi:hypothetical protein